MEKKYKIEFDGKELVFENEKEFKKFKTQCYNIHCDIMIDSQFSKGKVIRKPVGPDPEPEITLRDVLVMINNLTLEVREGFRKVNARLDKHEEILMRHEEILMRHEEILMRHEEIFKRNNLS